METIKEEKKAEYTSFGITFQSRELCNFFVRYLEDKGFNVEITVLCSTTPQYKVIISDFEGKRFNLSDAEKEVIRFYHPGFFN